LDCPHCCDWSATKSRRCSGARFVPSRSAYARNLRYRFINGLVPYYPLRVETTRAPLLQCGGAVFVELAEVREEEAVEEFLQLADLRA